jgi:ABC-type multidrug transport system fused ATPase/permease subunit
MRIRSRLSKIKVEGLRRVVRHFGGHLRPHRIRLVLSMLALLGVSLMTLLRPWPLKLVIDYLLNPNREGSDTSLLAPLYGWDPLSVVLLAAIGVLAIAAVNGFLGYSRDLLTKTVGHGITASIRLQLFGHIQRLPQSYHDYRETGELITTLTGDISLLQDLLTETFINLVGQLVIIIGMLVIAFFIDWQLSLLILAVMPFFVFASFSYSRKIKKAAGKQRERFGKMVSSMEETLVGIGQVKAFAQEKERDKLIGKSVSRDFKAGLKTTRLSASYARIVELVTALGTGLVLFVGAIKALNGSISPGDLVIFISYLRGIYRPIRLISRLSARIAKAVVRGEKVIDILEIEPEVSDGDGAVPAPKIKGRIKFENVNFAYVKDNYVLRDLSCHIPRSKTTVLIGPTGAGKSTIAKLLLRLYEPSDGVIYLDRRDISEYQIQSLRRKITSLTQEVFLFRTSLKDNIAFGKRRATMEEIERAARLVGADRFIDKFPDGYDTEVGEGGLTLSGGQRQKISFARAALRNSPIMIFDEPATGLDIHAEKIVKEALQALKPGRTLLVITHRLNFLDLADWAVFIRDGGLVEEGKPLELINNKGEFYNFVAQEIDRTGYDEWPDKFLHAGTEGS